MLLGGADADRITTRGGRQELTGGPGSDVLLAGSGPDLVHAADGERDVVNCGRGRDRVEADAFDRLEGCERRS